MPKIEMIKKYDSFKEIPSIAHHSYSGIIMPSVPRFILVSPKIFDDDLKVLGIYKFFSSLYFKIYFVDQKIQWHSLHLNANH